MKLLKEQNERCGGRPDASGRPGALSISPVNPNLP